MKSKGKFSLIVIFLAYLLIPETIVAQECLEKKYELMFKPNQPRKGRVIFINDTIGLFTDFSLYAERSNDGKKFFLKPKKNGNFKIHRKYLKGEYMKVYCESKFGTISKSISTQKIKEGKFIMIFGYIEDYNLLERKILGGEEPQYTDEFHSNPFLYDILHMNKPVVKEKILFLNYKFLSLGIEHLFFKE